VDITQQELQDMIRSATQDALADHLTNRVSTPEPTVKGVIETLQTQSATVPHAVVRSNERPREKGDSLGRLTRLLAATRGFAPMALYMARNDWNMNEHDPVVRALATNVNTAGGFLVKDEMATEIIELLRPASIVRSFNPMMVSMTGGSLTMEKVTGGATAEYIGEGDDAPVTQQTFGQIVLTWKKLAAIVPISNDLLRKSSTDVDRIVRNDLIAAFAQREDRAFLRSTGSVHTPRGLRYQAIANNVFASTQAGGAATLAEVDGDLSKMLLRLRNANARMRNVGWMMSPRSEYYLMGLVNTSGQYVFRDEMNNGTLRKYPYKTSTEIPDDLGTGNDESEVYLVDFSEVVIADSEQITLSMSEEATYNDGGTLRSAFSRDQTLMKAIAEHDLGLRHDGSVVVLTTVAWGV
jgi:HK97 family phage major capsid protein